MGGGKAKHCVQDGQVMNGGRANEKGCTPFKVYQSMYADDSACVTTSRWDVDHSLTLIFSTLEEFSLTMRVGRATSEEKQRLCFSRVPQTSKKHTPKLSHFRKHTHTRTHSTTPTHASTPTRTHLTNMPWNSHQHPPLLCSERRRRNASVVKVSRPAFRRVFKISATLGVCTRTRTHK